MNPGQDEKAGVVHYQVQVFLANRRLPAYEAVSGRQLPGGCPKTNRTQQPLVPAKQIAHLGSSHWAVVQVMVMLHQGIVEC